MAKLRLANETARLYVPLPKQLAFHSSRAQGRMFRAGNQVGKTLSGAMEAKWWSGNDHPYRPTPKGPMRGLVVGVDWTHIGKVCWQKLRGINEMTIPGRDHVEPILPDRVIKHVAWLEKGKNIPEHVELTNGSIIDFGSVDSGRERFQGRQYNWIWFDEDMPDEALFQELMVRLMRWNGEWWWTLTPLAEAELAFDMHQKALVGELDYDFEEFNMSLHENPFISEKAKKNLIALCPTPEIYKTRVEGEFLLLFGRVFKELRPKTHFVEPYRVDPLWTRYIVIDPGNDFGALWIAVDKMGDAVVYREYEDRPTDVVEAARAIASMSRGERYYKFIIDPAARQKTIASKQMSVQIQLMRAFEKFDLSSKRTGHALAFGDNDRDAGIMELHTWFKTREGRPPRLTVFDTCAKLRRELMKYRYKKETQNTALKISDTVKKEDHLVDALRYFVMDMPRYYKEKGILPGGTPSPYVQYELIKKRRQIRAAMRDRYDSGGARAIGMNPR